MARLTVNFRCMEAKWQQIIFYKDNFIYKLINGNKNLSDNKGTLDITIALSEAATKWIRF